MRRPEASDIPALVALWVDADVTRHMGGPRDPETVRASLEQDLRRSDASPLGFWPVVEKGSGRVVGDCGLVRKDVDGQSEVELVYVFAAEVWGRGYATEAASALRDYAFRHVRLPRLIALIDPENVASARVAEKVGMQLERDTVRPGGRVMQVYAVPAPDSDTGLA